MSKTEKKKVRDIKQYLSELGRVKYQDEGLHFGDPNQVVEKAMVCWMANVDAIEYAGKMGVDLIVTHESLFLPYDILNTGGVSDFLTWRSNRKKVELLSRHGISVIRSHGTLDEVCIFDDFAAFLGLPEPVISEPWLVKIYDIEEIEYGDLVEKVKKAFNLKHTRYTDGNPKRRVKRIGLPWGGLGLKGNAGYMQKLIDHGCEVLIAGEAENYSFNFIRDAGADMIETGHDLSENLGLRHFSRKMAGDFKDIEVLFYENKSPFVCR